MVHPGGTTGHLVLDAPLHRAGTTMYTAERQGEDACVLAGGDPIVT
ncbi:hypothetical protein ACI784_15685 [Geodermatophilus sp. SYSU D01186]